MKKIVILSGAGISAESGLGTFRGSGGLWEGYNIYDVATPEAWAKDPKMVQEFYNMRRKGVVEASPNAGHKALLELEQNFDVQIITQNIDDLHERAGSTNVLHLHGKITQARSSVDPDLLYDLEGWEIKMGDKCELGSQLRPHVVWFGEAVPAMEEAALITAGADAFCVIGTSLQVYPAAGLVNMTPAGIPLYLVDPNADEISGLSSVHIIKEKASSGAKKLVEVLVNEFQN